MNLRKLKKSFGFAFALLLICAAILPARAAEAEAKKIFEIDILMQKGAEVTVTAANGKTFAVASVAALPVKTRYPSYTASAWGEPGSVCASAVNAVHMLVSVEKGRGRTLSIIPKETIAPAAGPGASIVLDAKAGESVFGAWAPAVGSRVSVRGADGASAPLAADNLPKAGDTLVIEVFEDPSLPYMVDIENRPGGRVVAWYSDGYKILGRVLVALGGTGRFEGTLFQTREPQRRHRREHDAARNDRRISDSAVGPRARLEGDAGRMVHDAVARRRPRGREIEARRHAAALQARPRLRPRGRRTAVGYVVLLRAQVDGPRALRERRLGTAARIRGQERQFPARHHGAANLLSVYRRDTERALSARFFVVPGHMNRKEAFE